MTFNETDQFMNKIGVDNANNALCISDGEHDNASMNESNPHSTSSGDGRIGTGDESSTSSRKEYQHHREELASKETHAVTRLKFLVFGSLFCSMVAVALSAYFTTAQGERRNFEMKFYDDAHKILGNMGHNVQRTMEVSDAFITSSHPMLLTPIKLGHTLSS
jgi:hypothetical protein